MTLTFDAVSFTFPATSRAILHEALFTLAPASCTALIGPNGAGKTTLLRLATGVLRPHAGSIHLDGEPLRKLSIRQAAQRIAIVPQQLEVPFAYSVEQVVEQGRTPHLGFLTSASAADAQAVDRAFALTRTEYLRHRIFNELSGGERQRVKIALGLAQNPQVLLLDEPTQNLDIGRQVELLDLLHQLRAEGITILASIHDLHLVEGNFDAALLLSPGMPLRFGNPAELLDPELLEVAFDCPPGRHPLLVERAGMYPVRR